MSHRLTPEEVVQVEGDLLEALDPVVDADNPEWTEEDFARAQGPEALSETELAAFPRTRVRLRGPQVRPTKTLVSMRLDREVLEHFRAAGAGWQTRINDTLKAAIQKQG